MIIIGERINSSRKKIAAAIERKNADFIKNEAISQREAGADFIDVNCGTFLNEEAALMQWLINLVQSVVDAPLCIDSPSSETIKKALPLVKNKPIIINSITAEEERANEILPLVKEYDAFVIALTMDEAGIPRTAEERTKLAERILGFAEHHNVSREKIYFDPLVQPVGSDQTQAKVTLDTITQIRSLGNTRLSCGLSNISYGLPDRPLLNATFLAMCIGAGLDAVMVDPLNEKLMSALSAALVLTGEDQYCMKYIQRFRKAKAKLHV
jgi:5-methyltetrahydrofolate--homocysteine methyltransferase